MRAMAYVYINMWKQGQYTDFVRKDYVSIREGLEAFIDGHTQFWRKFLQKKDKKRCMSCMQLMDITTVIASESSPLLIVRLCPSRYNRNGSIMLDDTIQFGGDSYRLFCVLYIMRSQYHTYYFLDDTLSRDEYDIMKRGAEILIYVLCLDN
jgi:hypothetical protein